LPDPKYIITGYSPEVLVDCLSHPKYTAPDSIRQSKHFKYFKEYFCEEKGIAKFIVIEQKYINRDFLSDYTLYYAKCFEDYPKHCKRLHLFTYKEPIDKNSFAKLLDYALLHDDEQSEKFWKNYLGYMVVKPIPITVIGTTVLKTYQISIDKDIRKYWGCRDYKINLFGTTQSIVSLAFQEQDMVVSACATTSIWTTLQKSSHIHLSLIKTPSEITVDAGTVESKIGVRTFPNKGLNIRQMCRAIKASGLDPEIRDGDVEMKIDIGDNQTTKTIKNLYIKKIINAYHPLGIPIIIVLLIPEKDKYYLHAVTVVGHRSKRESGKKPDEKITWRAELIKKLYVHDDKFGPFARVDFLNSNEIRTDWTLIHPTLKPTYAQYVIVPVYPKVRISYDDIEDIVHSFDFAVYYPFQDYFKFDLEWDIRVIQSNDYKAEIKSSLNDETQKKAFLTDSLPRFIWVATCSVNCAPIFEFVFDATDVSNNMICIEVISYYKRHGIALLRSLRRQTREYVDDNKLRINRYIEFIIKRLSEIYEIPQVAINLHPPDSKISEIDTSRDRN
jgi:hypothetical protein